MMKRLNFTKSEKTLLVIGILNILMIIVFGVTFGIVLMLAVTFAMFSWVILRRYKKKYDSKLISVAYKTVTIGIVTWITSFILIMALVITSITYDVSDKEYDYIVVLGAGLWGESLSLILEKRLEKAVELSSMMPEAKIIVSGGQGKDELISEAEAMRRYLVEHHIDDSRIISEDKSRSTSENFDFTKIILEEISDGEVSVLVITSDFHLFRAKRLAHKKEMVVDGVASETPMSVYLNYLAREYLAVLKSEFFD